MMRTPFVALKEANKRASSTKVETPLDFLRELNRERELESSTKKVLKRVRGY